MFFSRINPDIFSPLAGKSRKALNAETLLAVYDEFFADESLARRPTESDIKDFIRHFLGRNPDLLSADGSESEEEAPEANIVYVRLRDAGWFVEFRRGYRREVDMPSESCALASAMLAIRRGETRSFMGRLQIIAQALSDSYDFPSDKGSVLVDAHGLTRDFMRHLRTLRSAMRRAEQAILKRNDALQVVRSFFDEFFEEFVKGACLPLLRDNNPYKYRDSVIRDCQSIKLDYYKMERLADSIVKHGEAKTREAAMEIVQNAVEYIERAFGAVPEMLDEIKYYRSRMERRALNALIYLDRLRDTEIGQIKDAISAVAASKKDAVEDIPVPVQMSPSADIVGPGMLAEPKKPRARRDPVAIRTKTMDPALEALRESRKEFQKKIEVTPHMLRKYLEQHVAPGQTVGSRDLPVGNFEEFHLFEAVRFIGPRYAVLASEYEVRHLGEWRENEWIGHEGFVVYRKEVRRAAVL